MWQLRYCPKCGGDLFQEGRDWECLQCGLELSSRRANELLSNRESQDPIATRLHRTDDVLIEVS